MGMERAYKTRECLSLTDRHPVRATVFINLRACAVLAEHHAIDSIHMQPREHGGDIGEVLAARVELNDVDVLAVEEPISLVEAKRVPSNPGSLNWLSALYAGSKMRMSYRLR